MSMKEKLNKLLTAKQEQRNTLQQSLIDSDDKEERAAIGETLAALAKEIAEVQSPSVRISAGVFRPSAHRCVGLQLSRSSFARIAEPCAGQASRS